MNTKSNFLKNYFLIFSLTYLILITTKIFFAYYLKTNFIEFTLSQQIYAIFWGYRFDFATSGIIAFLITLFDFNKRAFSIIGAIALITVFFTQLGDILYFNEANRHIGYEVSDIFTDATSLFITAYSQYTLLTIGSMIMGLLLFIYFFKVLSNTNNELLNKSYIFKKFLIILITVFFARGMTQSIPLNPWQSNQIGDSKLATLSLNVTYNIIYSLANKSKKLKAIKIPTVTNDIIKQSFKELYPSKISNKDFPIIKTKPNIVFLFLESWSATYLKPYGYEYDTTPYFNEILKQSIRPTMMIAGGHRTTEGIFVTLTSFQNPLGKSVAKTQLQDFKFTSIIDILNKDNYSSAFFQGTSKETSGTGSLAQRLGFKYSYGKRDILKRVYKENYWGVHDTDLYNFVESKLSTTLKEPFVLGINGATTHDDKIPKWIKKIDFTKDEKLNNQLNAFHFSDFALKNFIGNIEEKYPNTIFVIFADHCGGNISGIQENYQIPFAIYSKELIKAKYHNIYMAQRDISPTIYDLAINDYKKSDIPFTGKSLIQDDIFFSEYYHNGILGWIEDDNIIEINTATNTMKCFRKVTFSKEKIDCNSIHEDMKNRALSFTNVSQDLLFGNKLNKIQEYK